MKKAARALCVAVSALLGIVACGPLSAKTGAIAFKADYSDVRGFNYNTVSSRNYEDQWKRYDHAEVDRHMGYAQHINLNLARIFLSYKAWLADKPKFRDNLRDFVRTAHAHGIGSMIVIVDGPAGMMADLFEESAKPGLRDYLADLYRAIGTEPGLSVWDAANEPDWVRLPTAPPNTNQPMRIKVAKFVAQELKRLDKRTPITIGCQFLTCTEDVAPYVDLLSYHDYSQTRAQIDADIGRARALGQRVGKPIMTTETGCVGRANPYDIAIEEFSKAKMGWMIWELMIARNWGNVHGIFYDDGTVRDPSLVAAVLGIYRNRGRDVVLEESDREGITSGILDDARKWLGAADANYFDGMVIAETEANLLESAQLVGMRELPTRKVELMRAQPQNPAALRSLIAEFSAALAPNAIPGNTPRHRFYTPAVPGAPVKAPAAG